MALTDHELTRIADEGFGPLSLTARGDHYVAVFDGRNARVALDRQMVRIDTEQPVSWPTSEVFADEVDQRVQRSVHDAASPFADVVVFTADPADTSVRVTLWADAGGNAYDLLAAVRRTLVLCDAAALAVDGLKIALRAEEQIHAQLAESRRSLDASDQLIAQARAAAPASSPVPPIEATPTGAPPTPVTAAAPVWCYVDAPVPVRAIDDTNRTVGTLAPGTWYRLIQEQGPWTRVAAPDGALDGWVPTAAVHRAEGP